MLHLGFDDGLVADHDVGEHNRVGQPVVGIVERADRMRERVDRPKPLLERGRTGRGHVHRRVFDLLGKRAATGGDGVATWPGRTSWTVH